MTQLDEAIARYHRLLGSDKYKDLGWAEALEEEMQARHLSGGSQAILPVLRPHFVTRRQYTNLVKASQTLLTAIDRVKQLALENPNLLARMELLPAEKMLAAVDPKYPYSAVSSRLDTHVENGSMHFMQFNVGSSAGTASSEALAELFYNSPLVKEFRRRHKLTRIGGVKHLLKALLDAYSMFGKKRFPRIAILELRKQFQSSESGENQLLAEHFRREGYPTEVVSPDQLTFRQGELCCGDFAIDLLYRRITAQEFLVRFDLSHPLVRAYKEGAVCMVNSFRAELNHKKAIFDLLTDQQVTAKFPAAERKMIRQHIPWTRIVSQRKTTYQGEPVDLISFIVKNREKLVLKPNDIATDQHAYNGWETDSASWEKALRTALRSSYVVQERVERKKYTFPLLQFGSLEMKEMKVDVQPHIYLDKVHGCSSWLSDASGASFSTLKGLAPTFILESRS